MVAIANPSKMNDVLRRKAALAIMGSIYGRRCEQIEAGTRERLPGASPQQLASAIVAVGKHLTVAIERDLLRAYTPGVDCVLDVPQEVLTRLITDAIAAAVSDFQRVQSC